MHNLIALFLALWIALVSLGLGNTLASLFKHVELPYRPYSDFALGIGILSHIIFLLGVLNLYQENIAWIILAIITLSSIKSISRSLKSLSQALTRLKPTTPVQYWLLTVLLFFGALSLYAGLIPPFWGDTITYHFTAPKFFIEAGGLVFFPSFLFNMPKGIEMLYLFGSLLHSEAVGLLLNNLMGFATALLIGEFVASRSSRTTGLLSALLYYSLPYGVWYASIIGKINLGLYLYICLGVFWFLEWIKTRHQSQLIFSGVFLGLAASAKYTGLYAVLALTALTCFFILSSQEIWSTKIKSFFLFLFSLFLFGSPWYLHNAIVLGNPVWPVFYPILGGEHYNMSAYLENALISTQAIPSLNKNLWGWLTGPLRMHLYMDAFFSKAGIGPLFMAFLPFSLFYFDIIRKNLHLYLICALFYSIWFCFAHVGLYLMPAVILLCIPLAETIHAFCREKSCLTKSVASAAVVLWLLISGGAFLERMVYFSPVIIGQETKENFLKRLTPLYNDYQWINKNVPANESLLIVGTRLLYYLERSAIFNGDGFLNYDQIHTSEDLLKCLNSLNIHYVLVVKGSIEEVPSPYEEIRRKISGELLSKYGQQIYHNPQAFAPKSIAFGSKIPLDVSVFKIHFPSYGD